MVGTATQSRRRERHCMEEGGEYFVHKMEICLKIAVGVAWRCP